MILGISGKIGSGKDTVGYIVQYLTDDKDFKGSFEDWYSSNLYSVYQIAGDWQNKKFAYKLKQIVALLLGVTVEKLEDREFKEAELGEEWSCWVNNSDKLAAHASKLSIKKPDDFFNDMGGVSYRKLTPRKILQLLGTEAGREIIHPNIWVNALMSEYKPKGVRVPTKGKPIWKGYPNWIITDMRFPNELEAVKSKKGVTIRVNRGDCKTCEHLSETALDNAEFDYVIDNNGSIEELIYKVRDILVKENLL